MERRSKYEIRRIPVTAELVYRSEMKRLGEHAGNFMDLSDMAIQLYEELAAMCVAHGVWADEAGELHQPGEA
ncbi:MAG: hypothetical protein WBP22_01770 [Candidatus Saccharimonas sp.]